MRKVTMNFDFSIPDPLFKKLESISKKYKKSTADLIGDILEANKGKFSILVLDTLTKSVLVFEKSKKRNEVRG